MINREDFVRIGISDLMGNKSQNGNAVSDSSAKDAFVQMAIGDLTGNRIDEDPAKSKESDTTKHIDREKAINEFAASLTGRRVDEIVEQSNKQAEIAKQEATKESELVLKKILGGLR